MKIGVLLREIGNQKDAPGIIVLNLLDQLLELDRDNQYVLFYKDRAFFYRYDRYPNVSKFLIHSSSKLVWDQVLVPLAAKKAKIDLLFSPKHSLPLLGNYPMVMHLRGSEYWTHPEYYEPLDLLYQKLMLPIFCRKASHLIVESNFVKRDFQRFLGIPSEKMTMIYLAPNERFRPWSADACEKVKRKYGLPDRFALTVTRIKQGKRVYPGKNLDKAIEAFLRARASREMAFVIVGVGTKDYVQEYCKQQSHRSDSLIALDYVAQEDLPAFYSLANLFLFPSSYESFGIPLAEAMACGCPIITSNTGACPEIVGAAGLTVNPHDVEALTDGIDRLTSDEDLRKHLQMQGFKERQRFSWEKAARETLRVFDHVRKL
ncbi:MAG: glycosyltransferase family 1 protein [Nitrospirae bacterium]|nr:MAG: glycosyltransferase family 1 protein [Nitrospirota bacterium]